MARAVLLLVCPDRPGIVADVASWVSTAGGNIVDAGQTYDTVHGMFVQRVEFDHDAPVDDLRASFTPVATRWSMRWDLRAPRPDAPVLVLVSREGHCLYDLLGRCATGDLPATVVGVVSNHNLLADAARRFEVPFHHLPVDDHSTAHEDALLEIVEATAPELIVLARYMRILSPALTERIGQRTINIHHSFLPAFAGANPYRQAWERGVKLIGATAHYVTADLDEGPIIAQDVTPVAHGDDPATLARRGRDLESLVLAAAVRAHLEHRVVRYSGRTVVFE